MRWALLRDLCPDKKGRCRRRPHGDGGRDSGDGAMELQGSGWKALSGRCGQSAPRAQGRQGSADTMFPEQGENGQLLS